MVATSFLALLMTLNGAQPLILRIVNRARIPADVLADARKEVDKIYRKAGVQIVWRADGESADEADDRAVALTVIITPQCLTPKTCTDQSVTGFAMSSEGRGLRRAYVYSDRVYDMAMRFHKRMSVRNPEGLVLGCAIAHEAGHLLLPFGHSESGLMRAEIDMRSIDDAMRGDLVFAGSQSDFILGVLRAAFGHLTFEPGF